MFPISKPAVKTRPKDILYRVSLRNRERESLSSKNATRRMFGRRDSAREESSAKMKLVIENLQSWKGKRKCCFSSLFFWEVYYYSALLRKREVRKFVRRIFNSSFRVIRARINRAFLIDIGALYLSNFFLKIDKLSDYPIQIDGILETEEEHL